MIGLTAKKIYLGVAALFALNAAFLLVPFVPLRLITAIGILFITPGVFMVRMVYPAQRLETLEGLVIVMLASIATNLMAMFALNVVARIPLSDAGILVSLAGVSLLFGVADFVVGKRKKPEVKTEKKKR